MTDETSQTDQISAQDAGEGAPDNLLALKMLVVALGVMLVVAMITFFILLFMKLSGGGEEEATGPAIVSSVPADGAGVPQTRLQLAPGEEIVEMDLDGRSLALRLSTPDGERIVVVDPYTADHRAVIDIVPHGGRIGGETGGE